MVVDSDEKSRLNGRDSFQAFNVLKVLLSFSGALIANEVLFRYDSQRQAIHFDHMSGLVDLCELYTVGPCEDVTVHAVAFHDYLLEGLPVLGDVDWRKVAYYLTNRSSHVLSSARRVYKHVEVLHFTVDAVKPSRMPADDDERDPMSLKRLEQVEVVGWNS
jgi:hypothetical protein